MNDVPESLLLSLRGKVIRVTGNEDMAQEACIELLYIDLSTKPIEYIIGDLVKKYKNKHISRRRNRKEVPTSELTDGDHDNFLDFVSANSKDAAVDAEINFDGVPTALHEIVSLTLQGFTLAEVADHLGVTYNALKQKLHYYKNILSKT